jgi:hypothetical protein
VNETKIAFKSGFEKYLRVEKDGVVRGVADAVGAMEQWEPVFQVPMAFFFIRKIMSQTDVAFYFYATDKNRVATAPHFDKCGFRRVVA